MGASVDFELSSTQYIEIGALLNGESTVTFACWVNLESLPASAPRPCVAGLDNTSAIFLTNSSVVILGFGEKFISMPHSFSTGTWYHLAWSYSSGSMLSGSTGYIDGVSKTLSDVFKGNETPAAIDTSTSPFRLGDRGNASDFMDGKVAYFHAYNTVLTQDEILEVMYKPGSVTNGLQAYFPLVGSSSEFINDISGNGWDGTNNGATESFEGPPVQFY